jgi:glutamate racemase
VIGILDDGLGGLAAVASIRRHLPDVDLLYLGDAAHGPCGIKSAETAGRFAMESARWLTESGARLILITAAGMAAAVADRLAQVIDAPVFAPIVPGAAQAAARSRKGAVGVIGDPLTIHLRAYADAVLSMNAAIRVHQAACPLLPFLIEEGRLKKPETTMIVRKYLMPLKSRQIDALIMGDAAYLRLSATIARKAGKRVALIDPFDAMAQVARDFLKTVPDLDARLPRNGRLRVLLSDMAPGAEHTARRLLGRNLQLEPAPEISRNP